MRCPLVALGFLGRVCQCLSRGMSLVCQPCDSTGRWAFLGDSLGRSCSTKVSRQRWPLWSTDRSLQAVWDQHLASAELFSFMLSSMFATISAVPTTLCTSNIIWSNTLQYQHVLFPVGVAFQSDTASSAQAGTTLPRQVYISQILHWLWCSHCSGGH